MSTLTFSTLSLAPAWLENLAQLGYLEMTPIQALALPAMLEGRDVRGQAATGTGKTAAFGLALLARITPRGARPGALVPCPTRELAAQVTAELRRLARPLPHTRVLTLSGGGSVQRSLGRDAVPRPRTRVRDDGGRHRATRRRRRHRPVVSLLMPLAIVVLVAACSSSHQRVPANVAVDTPARAPAPPTLATAGAKSCVLRDVVLLGPHGEGNAAVGFDRTSGIAAWKREPGVLAAVAIGFDGKPRGAVATMPVAEGVEPHGVRATVAGFVVLLRRWNIDAQRESWWTVAVDRDARMHPPVTVPAEPATPPQAAGPDDLEISIVNAATPPPPGPGGRIYEPMGRPVLERMHHGQRAGDPIHLEFHGNPIANGMNISTDVVWSGSHFIYPFWNDDGGPTHDKYAVFLLPIDCRPQPLPSSSR